VAVVAGIVLIWRAATHPVKKPEEAAAVVAENAA
jgi:hypothetical protein